MLSHICVKVYSYFKVRDSLVLFLLGVSLLLTGLHGVGISQIQTEGWDPGATVRKAPPATGRMAPPATAQLAPGAAGRLAPGAFARPAQFAVARPAAPAAGRLAQQPVNPGVGEAESKDIPYDDSLIRFSVGNLYKFIEGAFGALIVVGAGIGAIIAAAVGAYKAATALFVTAVGAFILRAYVSLFFGTNYDDYTVGVDDVNN